MSRTTMSLRIDEETNARLERLAAATERSKTSLLARALQDFLDLNEWQVAEISRGLADADARDLVDHEEVVLALEQQLAYSLDAAGRS